ncbi:glycosyltransferase [Providencia vermicola]|uniref:glycosyltransferase n=1 Tax=Providencia vermicola TaxID=333965 RepID=UPI003D2D20F4
MNNWAIISSKTRVFQALVLIESIIKNDQESKMKILAMDDESYEILSAFTIGYGNIDIFHEKNVISSDIKKLKTTRKYFAYCWTLKSVFCSYLMEYVPSDDFISYVDSDILFLGDVSAYLSKIQYSTFFVAEEHHIPKEAGIEIHKLKEIVGNFNSGFISFKNNNEGRKTLNWWEGKCLESCELNAQVFGDQKYLNEMPELFTEVVTERSIPLNVGPWNILKRTWSYEGDIIFSGKHQVLFYHFVGFKLKATKEAKFVGNIPVADEAFFESNPSGRLVYERYHHLLVEKMDAVSALFPHFSGFVDENHPTADWADYQMQHDILGLN